MKIKPVLSSLAWFAVLAALFALAYNQSPLYTSNQNQYFLHGLARAGYGVLAGDWLANTADPTPLFSALVAVTMRLFRFEGLFYVYYALLMGVYFFSLSGIVETVFPLRPAPAARSLFIAALILLHSAGLRFLLLRLFGGDWTYLFEGGVAGQRLLGPVFQPSTFGVFLLLSIYLYLRGRPVWAIFSAVLAATVHPTYLFSAAILTLAYVAETFGRGKRPWPALRLGLLALAFVAPILIYTIVMFGGSTPETAAEARSILVDFRIPHHARVMDWLNAAVVVKLAFLGMALYLVRRYRLFVLLGIPLALALVLTAVQAFLQDDLLALIFPWRPSTWLLPLAVALVTARLALAAANRIPDSLTRLVKTGSLILIALAVMAGMSRTYLEFAEAAASPARAVEAYAALHRQEGQQYAVPRDINDFRLVSGVPIYADFLAIPYRDSDVLEWYRRVLINYSFYQRRKCDIPEDFYLQGVTHIIAPVDFPRGCPALEEIYADDFYRIYLLLPE